jgi:serine protease Do
MLKNTEQLKSRRRFFQQLSESCFLDEVMISFRCTVLVLLFAVLPFVSFADTGHPTYLGVGVVPMDEQIARELNWNGRSGLFVTVVETGSPAAKAGLLPNDIIISFNGKSLRDPSELGTLVADLPAGRKVHLKIFRAGKAAHLTAVLASREMRPRPEPLVRFDLPAPDTFFSDMPSPALRWRNSLVGVEYEGVDSQLAQFFGVKHGVLIRFVQPGSAAGESGLHAGDVVTKVNGKAVATPRDFALALQNREPRKQSLTMEVARDHKERNMKIDVPGVEPGFIPWVHPVTAPR